MILFLILKTVTQNYGLLCSKIYSQLPENVKRNKTEEIFIPNFVLHFVPTVISASVSG